MSNYKKSHYAINKVRKGIVYRNADGSILEITFEKLAANDPKFTKEDFDRLKQLSDELYHEEEKADNLEAHYAQSSFNEKDFDEVYSAPSFEEELMDSFGRIDFMDHVKSAMNTTLTETERRRFTMHIFGGMTVREIAKIEKCYRNAVWKSITSAQGKIKKYLNNFSK